MLAASVAIRLRPFRRIAAALEAPRPSTRQADAETAYWIRRSVRAWGRRLPWRAQCFEQGLAAVWMLRRRGLAYQLHYGAARKDGPLHAHVWVTSGPVAVVGHETREAFSLLATFSG